MESVQNIAFNYFQLCNKLLQNNLLFIILPYFDDSLHLFILCINGLLRYVDSEGMQLQNKRKTEDKEIVSLLM